MTAVARSDTAGKSLLGSSDQFVHALLIDHRSHRCGDRSRQCNRWQSETTAWRTANKAWRAGKAWTEAYPEGQVIPLGTEVADSRYRRASPIFIVCAVFEVSLIFVIGAILVIVGCEVLIRRAYNGCQLIRTVRKKRCGRIG